MHRSIIAAALALASAALPAAAQSTKIEVPAGASWQHAQTKLILRSRMAGLQRTEIGDLSAAELDIGVSYGDTSDTWATVYIFRPAGGGLPIWYDRAETAILLSDHFPNAAPQSPPIAFAPPKSNAASGLRRVFVPSGGARSTALAVMPIGEWLVTVRLSSKTLDAAAIDARLSEAVASIGWPDDVAAALAAVPVAACTTSLAYPKKAKLKKPDMADGLLGAMLATMADDKSVKKEEGKPVHWCREGEARPDFATYRDTTPDGLSGYMLAIGDSGSTISVFPALMSKGGYQLGLSTLDTSYTFPLVRSAAPPRTGAGSGAEKRADLVHQARQQGDHAQPITGTYGIFGSLC